MEETGFIGENMDNVLRTINSAIPKEEEEAFCKLKDDDLRVAFMLKRDLIHDSLTFHASYEKKSPTRSKSARDDGNKLFKKKEYRDSVSLYTNSIMLAPTAQTLAQSLCTEGEDEKLDPKEQLPLAFANRSAALLHLRKYQLCIKDVDSAIGSGYPGNMIYKLHDRKGKCYMALKQTQPAKEEFEKAIKALKNAKLDEKALRNWGTSLERDLKNCEKSPDAVRPIPEEHRYEPQQVKDPHKNYPLLNSAVNVTYDETVGRHLKASAPIAVGDLILSEMPFASILLPDYYETHCYHCLKRLEAGVPDHQCANIQYCDDICRTKAWAEYHNTEHQYHNLFSKEWCGTIGHLVYRVITKVGFTKLMEFLEVHKKLLQEEKKGEILNGDGLYGQDFYSIYHMDTNIKQRVPEGLSDFAVFAVYITKVLQLSGFFKESKEPVVEPETRYNSSLVKVCSTVMRLLQITQINARGVIELMYPTDFEDSKPTEIGMAIYPTAALINHSCNPSAVAVFHQNHIEVLAISNIAKGKEVSIDYGMIFYKNVLSQRRMNMTLKYSFQCKCEACVKNWPLWRDLLTDYPVWRCENCGYELNVIRTIGGNLVRCDSCNHSQDLDERIQTLATSHDLFNKSMEEALEGKIEAALPGFKSHLSLCQKYLLPPWRDLVVSQAAVRQSLRLRGNKRLL